MKGIAYEKNKLLLISVISLLSLDMTGCANQVFATSAYSYERSVTHTGDYVIKNDIKVQNGKITSCSIDETYLPSTWARVSEADKDKTEVIAVDGAYDYDGTIKTIYFAKYIKVGDLYWIGNARDSEDVSYNRGEYVTYTYQKVQDSESDYTDINRYLNTADSGVYKLGSRYAWYYDCVQKGNIKIAKETSGIKVTADTTTYPSLSFVFEDTTITPYFPTTEKVRSSDITQANWLSSTQAFQTYVVGKKLNYSFNLTDENKDSHTSIKNADGIWNYNPGYAEGTFSDDNWEPITGCSSSVISLTTIMAYFSTSNIAFASLEYDSLK